MAQDIGKRLLSAAEFVRQGAYFSDIGTDHAYLPIFLLKSGKITHAVCSDVNEGPLMLARENVEREGLADKATFRLTSGAEGLSDMGITDFAICGMGGELIVDIIETSFDIFSSHGVRIILQPMSRQGCLRTYLAKRGFKAVGESYSRERGRYYLTVAAEYTGETREISDFEAEFGTELDRVNFSQEKIGYFKAKIKALEKVVRGKELGGEADIPEAALLARAREIFKELL